MKTVFKLMLAATLLGARAFGQSGPISNLPTTNAAKAGDNLVLNSTNSGAGTWTTKRQNVTDFVSSYVSPTITGQTNAWSTNGNKFQSIVWHSPLYLPGPAGATISSGVSTTGAWTGSAGAFADIVHAQGPGAQGYGMGYQINVLYDGVHTDQYWIESVPDDTHMTTTFRVQHFATNASFFLSVPSDVLLDTSPNPQGGIEGDATFWSASGSLSHNTLGGGYYFQDGVASGTLKMNSFGGPAGSDALGMIFDITHQTAPSFYISYLTPGGALGTLPSGVVDVEVGLTNDTGPLTIGGALKVNGGSTTTGIINNGAQTNTGGVVSTGFVNVGVGTNTGNFAVSTGNLSVASGTASASGNVTTTGGFLVSGSSGGAVGSVTVQQAASGNGPSVQLFGSGGGGHNWIMRANYSGDGNQNALGFLDGNFSSSAQRMWIDGNGVLTVPYGFASTLSSQGNITATGLTNIQGWDVQVIFSGTSVSWAIGDAISDWTTNLLVSGVWTVILPPNGKIHTTTGSGLSGQWHSL